MILEMNSVTYVIIPVLTFESHFPQVSPFGEVVDGLRGSHPCKSDVAHRRVISKGGQN